MRIFDQAARYAAQAGAEAVPRRLLRGKGAAWRFREWLDTRTIPLPGGSDRTADLVAALEDPAAPEKPWLMVLEFQAQVDPDKLDVTLEKVAILRSRARHGEDRKGKYRVVAGLIYLQDRCPEDVLDMTLLDGSGTRHAALVWNVAEDNAEQAVEGVAAEEMSWGLLFWPALMAGGGDEGLIARWKEVLLARVEDRRIRGNLVAVALVFAELAGCVPAWKRGLEGFEMTESQVVNEWISQGVAKALLKERRQNLIDLLEGRFPGLVPAEVAKLIHEQDSLDLLGEWFKTAVRVNTFEQFMNKLRE